MRALSALGAVAAILSFSAAWSQENAPLQPLIAAPVWLEQPTLEDMVRYYPHDALALHMSGRVVVDCLVVQDGRLECTIISEDPMDRGFGEAALLLSQHFKIAPQTAQGLPTAGRHILRDIRFRPSE